MHSYCGRTVFGRIVLLVWASVKLDGRGLYLAAWLVSL